MNPRKGTTQIHAYDRVEALYYHITDVDLITANLETLRLALQSELFTLANSGQLDMELHDFIRFRLAKCRSKIIGLYQSVYQRDWKERQRQEIAEPVATNNKRSSQRVV